MSWGATFCLISGASRGIGQAIAVEISKKLGEASVLLLLARTQAGLDETKKLVNAVAPTVNVQLATVDLVKAGSSDYKKIIEESLKNTGSKTNFKKAVIIHNAAAVMNRQPMLTLDNDENIKQDLAINFLSLILLNTEFFKIFDKQIPSRTAVQISACISEIAPVKTGIYASIKSARNQLFRVLANEEPTVRALSYDPGIVETEMLGEFLNSKIGPEQKKMFEGIEMPVQRPADTAKVLVEYLESGDFKSGSLVNAYRNPDLYDQRRAMFEGDTDALMK